MLTDFLDKLISTPHGELETDALELIDELVSEFQLHTVN